MKSNRIVLVAVGVVCFLGGTMIPSARTEAQAQAASQPPKYYIVNCMKAKPGQYQQSVQMEGQWKPIAQSYINAGKMRSWAVYGYQFNAGSNATCDYLTVDGYDKFSDLENTYSDLETAFKKIYPTKQLNDFMQQLNGTHDIANQDVMVLTDHAG